ncbi:MAG: DUF4402 domain-containing protein [Tenuifilaceae bacterium]|jgi:hypothetical protein|nr:DUF4402 domain-containing protein [Tenuifilaceae bacterium]
MKKFAILFAGLFLMTFAFQSVNAQNSVTSAAALTSARIIQTLEISKDRDLDFGTFTAVDGNVILSPDESTTRTTTGPVLSGGTAVSAKFTVTGSAGELYTTSIPTSITLTNTNTTGGGTLTLTPSINVTGNSGVLSGTLGSGNTGTQILYVGGSLAVLGTSVTGLYQNNTDMKVTVNYN